VHAVQHANMPATIIRSWEVMQSVSAQTAAKFVDVLTVHTGNRFANQKFRKGFGELQGRTNGCFRAMRGRARLAAVCRRCFFSLL